MKKLINNPDDVVNESLAGVAAAHADLVTVSYDPAYVARADAPVKGKVGIVSGGGSGHEPLSRMPLELAEWIGAIALPPIAILLVILATVIVSEWVSAKIRHAII